MRTITYNLRGLNGNSNEYYQKIHEFSKTVFDKIACSLGDVINELLEYVKKNELEKPRSEAEYAVEILTLGMAWHRYLGASQRTSKVITHLLKYLYKLRSSNQKLKPTVDKLRGLLTSIFIVPKIKKKQKNGKLNFTNFNQLINWLEATGEFKDETKRLKIWLQFFKTNGKNDELPNMDAILEVFKWFKTEAKISLGKYTTNLEQFLNQEHPKYKFREDVIFCGKEEVEYHLNMVGSEIINWGFQASYEKTSKKVLLVPACMQINNGTECKAVQKGFDIKCTFCNKNCRINQLTQLGKKNNFDVFIVPHSSSFTKWLKKWENSKKTGLVAVACLLNLVPGGYEMRELNIPAQCVLLDFCGCKKHWDSKGIETELNEERLLELIR